MRIERLVLEKYGSWQGRTIAFRPDAHLHVVAGPNEAGKTSALAAIADALFGFPHSTAFDFRFPQTALRLGMTLRLADGRTLTFRRRKGRGANTILDDADKPLGEDLLAPVLRNLDRAAFESEYGLTAERLRKGGEDLLAAGGRLAESLAAGSAGLSALSRVRAELQAQADALFTARKVESKRFYIAAEDFAARTRQLREAIVSAEDLRRASEECDRLGARQTQLLGEHDAISRDLSRLARARSTRAKLRQIGELEEALAALADVPEIAAGQGEEWRAMLARLDDLQPQLREALDRRRQAREAIARLALAPDLIAAAKDVAALVHARGGADQSRSHLPRRREERHAAWTQLETAARDLGLAGAGDVVQRIPAQVRLAAIRATLQKRRDLETLKQDLQQRIARERKRADALAADQSAQTHVADPADLDRAFAAFEQIPADCALLRQHEADIRQTLADLETRIARLTPPPPPLDDLARLPLPSEAAIEDARRQQAERERRQQAADDRLATLFGEMDAAERELKQLAQAGDIATANDLKILRGERDRALEQAAGADKAGTGAAIAALRALHDRIDRMTDGLLADADRAARKLALEQTLAEAKRQVAEQRKLRAEIDAGAQAAQEAWRALWSPTDIEPGPPEAMARWLAAAQRAIGEYDALSRQRADAGVLADKLAAQVEPLKDFLHRLGPGAPANAPVEHLYKLADRGLDELKERWSERRLHVEQIRYARKEIADLEEELARHDADIRARAGEWAEAMAALCCDPAAGLDEAGAALDIWERAIGAHTRFADEDYRLTGIQKDIAAFEERVGALCARLAPDLSGADAFVAVDILSDRLQQARDAAREHEGLLQREQEAGLRIERLEVSIAAAQTSLAAAAADLQCEPAGLGAALERLARRERLRAEMEHARRDLAAMADGASAGDLRAEQAGLDLDGIDGEIERLELRARQALAEWQEAAGAANDARRRLDALTEGGGAAAIARQRQEAAAELLAVARRWLVRAGAARLAGQAIERHRERAQDPVLARASALFSQATGGAFAGLALRYDERDEPVFRAVRTGGEDVPVAGLSDGARDQLFLALRLALLEQRPGEAPPFIGDDLLSSFDEGRAGCALEMLAGLGVLGRQTILFTHHRHVAEIAIERLGPAVDVIELDGAR